MTKTARSIKNQYRGINAHLHSKWIAEAGWNNFHTPHIAELTKWFVRQLRPRGYDAVIEESLQIRRVRESSSLMAEDNPIAEKPYTSIVIYKPKHQPSPVARLEILSPTTKAHEDDRSQYLEKRHDLIRTGVVFVEVDYLHDTPPTAWTLTDYSTHEPRSKPYRILVFDYNSVHDEEGIAFIEGFDTDTPIPPVFVPLVESEAIAVNFATPYRQQFEDFFYGDKVNYAELPAVFDHYSPDDQTRIVQRMVAVLQAHQQGKDLEVHAPLPVDAALTLEAGLAQLAEFNSPG